MLVIFKTSCQQCLFLIIVPNLSWYLQYCLSYRPDNKIQSFALLFYCLLCSVSFISRYISDNTFSILNSLSHDLSSHSVYSGIHVGQSLIFWKVSCRLLVVYLLFFLWPLHFQPTDTKQICSNSEFVSQNNTLECICYYCLCDPLYNKHFVCRCHKLTKEIAHIRRVDYIISEIKFVAEIFLLSLFHFVHSIIGHLGV